MCAEKKYHMPYTGHCDTILLTRTRVDYECLASLRLEDIPSDLSKVRFEKVSESDKLDPVRGPLDIENVPNN